MKLINIKQFQQKIVFIFLCVVCLFPIVSSPLALAIGFIVSLTIGNPFGIRIQKTIHLLLQISIVGLGFGLKFNEALEAGKSGFLLTVGSIILILTLGFFIGRALNIDKKLSYLISTGTSICGGSAIAAISPVINPDVKQISIALAIIFTLNSIALFIYPLMGNLINLSQEQFGLWCAIGIHDTSSVVGAASKYGNVALKIATTVKLARALWIIPISIFSMIIFNNKRSKIKIPWFIGLFIVAILLNTFLPVIDNYSGFITKIAKAGLTLTLFLIGSTLSINTLKTIGFKPLILAIILWVTISIGSLLIIIQIA